MNFSELRDLMLLYAAEQADDRERETVERWLASGDPVAAAVLAEARAMLAQLPLSLSAVEPSADMLPKLEERLGRASSAESTPFRDGLTLPASRPAEAWRVLAAAAVVGVVASVGTYFFTQQRYADDVRALAAVRQETAQQRERLDAITQQIEAATATIKQYETRQGDLDELQRKVADQDQRLRVMTVRLDEAKQSAALIQSPVVQTVTLAGTDEMPGAAGRIMWNASQDRLLFVGSGFVPPAADLTYQLWFVTDTAGPVSLGTFVVDANGRATYEAELPTFDASVQVVAVSLEPAGGSPNPGAPSGPVVLAGEL